MSDLFDLQIFKCHRRKFYFRQFHRKFLCGKNDFVFRRKLFPLTDIVFEFDRRSGKIFFPQIPSDTDPADFFLEKIAGKSCRNDFAFSIKTSGQNIVFEVTSR